MKDSRKPCEHEVDDCIYKEVVVIGNGPSGMVTSFMLAGNVPYLKDIPEDLPIDEMLRIRLSNIPPGQSLYEVDLMELADGLEGRSQNPIPLLMDTLLLPGADLGLQNDSLIEWKHDEEKEIDHVVLGRTPPGGSWHGFPRGVHTLSPGAWLALPPLPARGGRLPAPAPAAYCRRYVRRCGLQKYFRSGVTVTSVSRTPRARAPPCSRLCPYNARYCVSGYDNATYQPFRYACTRVVLAAGAGDRPNTLARARVHAAHTLVEVERALQALSEQACDLPVLVVGSGLSAADAVRCARDAGREVAHAHRGAAPALAKLCAKAYPDYGEIYKMMCDGPSGNHHSYTPYPHHAIIDVTPLTTHKPLEDEAIRPKRVKLLDLVTKEVKELTVSLIAVLIGAKPDLFFLQTNFNLNCIQVNSCKCQKYDKKVKIDENQRACFLRHHWHYIKSVLGICKSRFSGEINGNTDAKCAEKNCDEHFYDNFEDCNCDNSCADGIGFGLDPTKAVDGRSNPIAIDTSTHELLNAPEGMYALGPLTGDNFVRFISGGALAIVATINKEIRTD